MKRCSGEEERGETRREERGETRREERGEESLAHAGGMTRETHAAEILACRFTLHRDTHTHAPSFASMLHPSHIHAYAYTEKAAKRQTGTEIYSRGRIGREGSRGTEVYSIGREGSRGLTELSHME